MPQTQQAEKSIVPGSMLPIRTVADLTGINPVTLRAWERRYGLIQPTRTESGHRLYSMRDVEAVREILGSGSLFGFSKLFRKPLRLIKTWFGFVLITDAKTKDRESAMASTSIHSLVNHPAFTAMAATIRPNSL